MNAADLPRSCMPARTHGLSEGLRMIAVESHRSACLCLKHSLIVILSAVSLAACGGGGGDVGGGGDNPPSSYAVGGSITGLSGTVVLQNSGGETSEKSRARRASAPALPERTARCSVRRRGNVSRAGARPMHAYRINALRRSSALSQPDEYAGHTEHCDHQPHRRNQDTPGQA